MGKPKQEKQEKLVEVARSFSMKLNLGNFSNADFFCSQKSEVPESEADQASKSIYEWCKKEVLDSLNSFKKEWEEKVDISTGLPIIQQEEKPQPRTKYGKDNCGCRFGMTCGNHKMEFQIDAEQYDKENPRVKDEVPAEFK